MKHSGWFDPKGNLAADRKNHMSAGNFSGIPDTAMKNLVQSKTGERLSTFCKVENVPTLIYFISLSSSSYYTSDNEKRQIESYLINLGLLF